MILWLLKKVVPHCMTTPLIMQGKAEGLPQEEKFVKQRAV